jgi:hypothetical protein
LALGKPLTLATIGRSITEEITTACHAPDECKIKPFDAGVITEDSLSGAMSKEVAEYNSSNFGVG